MPGLEVLDVADLQGVRAAQAQEGPEQQAAGRPHAREGSRPGAAGQAQQDLFGLVVQGVAEQDRRGSLVPGRSFQRCVACIPCGSLRAHPGTVDGHGPEVHRGEAQFLQYLDGGGSHLGRALLQLVVNHHGADRQGVPLNVAAAGEIGCHRREGQ